MGRLHLGPRPATEPLQHGCFCSYLRLGWGQGDVGRSGLLLTTDTACSTADLVPRGTGRGWWRC